MTTAIVFLAIALLIGLIVFGLAYSDEEDRTEGLVSGFIYGTCTFLGISLVICGIWFISAGPFSNYQRDVCQQKAEGYGLERSDWSFRHDCRVYLPSGLLVPEGRIRITESGGLIVAGDGDN